MIRRLLLVPLAASALLLGACGSDDEAADTSSDSEESTTTAEAVPDDEQDAQIQTCIDQLFALLEEADYTDTSALSAQLSTELEGVCASVDQNALGAALEARGDELGDEAYAFIFGQTRAEAEAADVSGDPCVELSEALPDGSPDVPVPVGPPPTELVVDDLVVGDGDEVAEGATVEVDYVGVACSTGAVFDTSYGGEPVEFPLDGVIPGWSEGLVGMKVGGTRLLVIPPDLGYGSQGAGDDIAPGETLVFVVELRSVA